MITRFYILVVLVVAFAGAKPAFASDLNEARVSLTSGQYDEAFAKAQLVGNTEAFLVAAEALNTKILIGQSKDPKGDAKKAMAIAEQILATDPSHKDAKLLYAISFGFYGRAVSPIKAWRKKFPQKIEAAIKEAVAANPEKANSYALYGGWHMGVSAKAGSKTAQRSYGASIESGIANFKKARELVKDDIMINANYALMLYASDADSYGAEIEPLLADIRNTEPQDSAQIYVKNYISVFEKKLDQPKLARKSAKQFLGW